MTLDCEGRFKKITQVLNYLNMNGFLTNLVLLYDESIRAENIEEKHDLPSLTIDTRDGKLRFKYFTGSRTIWLFHTQDLFKALIEHRKEYGDLTDRYRPRTKALFDIKNDVKASIRNISYRYYPDMDNEIVYDILFSSETKGMEAELLSKIDEKLKSLDLADDLKFIINFDFEDKKCTACERERNARKNKET